MTQKTGYTAALIMTKSSILLVRKTRPKWQVDLWNAVGGKVEPGETPEACNAREVSEETGLYIHSERFTLVAVEEGRDYVVSFFKVIVDDAMHKLTNSRNDVDEQIAWHSLYAPPWRYMVGNLRWLIPLAQDWRRLEPVMIDAAKDDISTRPSW
jgi:ADP-ribose pyrophosphatase YjhB (NUDIX family)